ncbi:glycosyltransferase [Geobacter sp. SVR]|uniref:glycosyltransferase n=1 Tax=Geobacter sp. SVR TaxID=2495594 RepID=UPI00143EF5C5|nr:glycosyltransferase [Geobacter sp. SVR]BCS55038.1 glycosyl transferase [Geobacter sp. SVR]GCF85219.1 glycosyl transferase [Geobacter sp. SVR]
MRAILISPYSRGPVRGNITTVNRIGHHLQRAGAEIAILPLDAVSPEEIEAQALSFMPDIVHAFHIRYCGERAADLAERLKRPLVITVTGSDIYDDALRGHLSTTRALARADSIVCFSVTEAEQVAAHFPGVARRCAIIPQGVECRAESICSACRPDDKPFVLLPAALRPVKNIESAIRATEGIRMNGSPLRLLIAGGVIDRAYAATIFDLISRSSWVRWLGEVPYHEMGALYREAGVVLNTSLYEGMPNCLMEAMALGRPVLAVDIPGNRSLIRHGETGWLYAGEEGLRDRLVEILGDRALRIVIGTNAERYIRENHDPVREAEAYLNLYRSLA